VDRESYKGRTTLETTLTRGSNSNDLGRSYKKKWRIPWLVGLEERGGEVGMKNRNYPGP